MSANQHPLEQTPAAPIPDWQKTTNPPFVETAEWPPLLGILADQLTADAQRLSSVYPAPAFNLAQPTDPHAAKKQQAQRLEVSSSLGTSVLEEPSIPLVATVFAAPVENQLSRNRSRRWLWIAAASALLIPTAGLLGGGWRSGIIPGLDSIAGDWTATGEISRTTQTPVQHEIAGHDLNTFDVATASPVSHTHQESDISRHNGTEPISFRPRAIPGDDFTPTQAPPARVFQSLSAPQREAFLDLLEEQALPLDSLSI